jgi:hypothetical protein
MAEKTKKPIENKPKPEMAGLVQVPEKQLAEIMATMESLRKDRDMLMQIADKRGLANYYARHRDKVPARVFLRTYPVAGKDGKIEDKVILGWRSTKDVPPQLDPATGRWAPEDQRCELLFEDGTSSGEIYQATFSRNYHQVEAEVKSRVVDEVTGNVALKVVRLDNGKSYTIGVAYVN